VTDLEDGQAAAAVARDVAIRLLAVSKEAVAGGADVPARYLGIFPTAYGWWRFICRSAEAALLLGEHGFTVEAAPVLRNIVNHAYALHWLVDNGPLAVDALIAKDREGAEKMCNNLEQADWPAAAEYRRLLEERKAQPTPARSAADEELLRKLKHELGNVYDMLNRYASAEVYLVYSHLSGTSHTSVETANAYLEWTGGGTFQIRDEAADPGPAAAIQLSVALLQAASVMNGLLADNPLQANIDAAAADLGLQGTALFHDRVR
jgi:Family of unknown function (DUF5677)